MAVQYPDAKFVGIDLSSRQIDLGREAVRTLGVTNLELRTASITDVSPDWGTFDYILCHGVYSWVPDAVQDAILGVCRANLSPDGVGYVSYNTYPGWHMRGMLREMMCFHAARFTQPEEQVKEARLLLDFLAEACGGENTPHALLLAQESQLLRQQSDSYLYHEHLEEFNTPCYFAEFAKKVKASGLQYLGDAALPSMFAIGYPPKVLATLQRLCRDQIQYEQYLDFVRNRMFRASLVCHAGVELNRTIDASVIEDLHFASSARRAAEQPANATAFGMDSGATVTTADPQLVAALDALAAAWPGTLAFPQVAERVNADTPAARTALSGGLLQLLSNGGVVASAAAARCGNAVPEMPDVGALARHTATAEGWLPTLRHTVIRLDDFGKRVVPLLDGTRTQAEVMDQLMTQFRTGKLTLHQDGSRVRDEGKARDLLTKGLANLLETLRRGGALRA